jgi:adenylate kinase
VTTDIALFGPPGAGKGTQAKPLAAQRDLVYIATGDLLRTAVANDSQLGRAARRFVDAGELVPDELVLGLLVEAIERRTAGRGFVFDGVPRTTAQAEALDSELEELGRPPLRAILIDVPDEVLIERLAGRRVCALHGHEYHVEHRPPARAGVCDIDGSALRRRNDDDATTVRRRLAVYHEQTEPLIEFYVARQRLLRIDGVDHPSEIRRQLTAVAAGPAHGSTIAFT